MAAAGRENMLLKDGRILPSASMDNGDSHNSGEHEGVEVVLGTAAPPADEGAPQLKQDQNVFRPPRPVRPTAVRAHHHSGYAPRHHAHAAPYSSASSRSFDDGYYHQQHPQPHPHQQHSQQNQQSHYTSPNVHYPQPHQSGHPSHADSVNVISPNHKTAASGSSPSRPPPYHYQYPPASPVSRPDVPAATGASSSSPPRLRRYDMPPSHDDRYATTPRGGGSAGPGARPEDSPHPPYAAHPQGPPPPPRGSGPPVVADSFDSEQYASHHSHASHPATPDAPHYGTPRSDYHGHGHGHPPPPHPHSQQHSRPHSQYPGGSFAASSFDSHGGPPPPASHYYDDRYANYSPHSSHPESPYPPRYPPQYSAYSPGGYYDPYHSPYPDYSHSGGSRGMHGYDDRHGYGPQAVSPEKAHNGMSLPVAAAEINFDVTDPPMEPVTQPSTGPVCDSPAEVNTYDVLLGRGGGTNSQIGNRKFRKLVQDFQQIYLTARRKEKPLLARTIVLIIRKRGGRFLKKDDETGRLFEVGDSKAEAKTSQALREGLDVRATKSASTSGRKKKKKNANKKEDSEDEAEAPATESIQSPASAENGSKAAAPESSSGSSSSSSNPAAAPERPETEQQSEAPAEKARTTTDKETPKPEYVESDERKPSSKPSSPPILPKLQGSKPVEAPVPARPGSPESMHFRKRRRMRSGDGSRTFMGNFQDKLFSEFCPPRADLARAPSPAADDMSVVEPSAGCGSGPPQVKYEDDDAAYQGSCNTAGGCAGIALDMVTGAAAGSFFLGPRKWK